FLLCRHPQIARNATRYLVSRSNNKRVVELKDLVKYLGDAELPDKQAPVLAGIQDALAGLREFAEPEGWKDVYAELSMSQTPEVKSRAESLAVLFGNVKAIADL